ncbi:MAG: CARDB domain-containing protein [Thermoplasmatota archaeon]
MRATLLAVLVASLGFVAFVPPASSATTHTVTGYAYCAEGGCTSIYFSPDPITIDTGDSISFVNGENSHGYDDGTTNCDFPCTVTYAQPGTVSYLCTHFAGFMSGNVIVVGPASAITSPAAAATVVGTITEAGTASTDSGVITSVETRIDGGAWSAATLNASAASVSWSRALDTGPLTDATHRLDARATRTDGKRSIATVAFTVANPPTFDFTIKNLAHPRTYSPLTDPTITFALANGGNTGASPGEARIDYQDGAAWKTLATLSTPTVAAHGATNMSWTWPQYTLRIGVFPIRVVADPNARVSETDEANNVAYGNVTFLVPEYHPIDVYEAAGIPHPD